MTQSRNRNYKKTKKVTPEKPEFFFLPDDKDLPVAPQTIGSDAGINDQLKKRKALSHDLGLLFVSSTAVPGAAEEKNNDEVIELLFAEKTSRKVPSIGSKVIDMFAESFCESRSSDSKGNTSIESSDGIDLLEMMRQLDFADNTLLDLTKKIAQDKKSDITISRALTSESPKSGELSPLRKKSILSLKINTSSSSDQQSDDSDNNKIIIKFS